MSGVTDYGDWMQIMRKDGERTRRYTAYRFDDGTYNVYMEHFLPGVEDHVSEGCIRRGASREFVLALQW